MKNIPRLLVVTLVPFAIACVVYYPFSQAAASQRGLPVAHKVGDQLGEALRKDPRFARVHVHVTTAESGAAVVVNGTVDYESDVRELEAMAHAVVLPPEVEMHVETNFMQEGNRPK